MEAETKRRLNFLVWIWCILFFIMILLGVNPLQAVTLGKSYDSHNCKQIKDMVPPFVLAWVKKGDLVLKTGQLNFEFRLEKDFLERSQKNAGQFDINEKGFIVDNKTRQQPNFIYGLPFPEIDFEDPMVGQKIVENYQYGRMRMGGYIAPAHAYWIGRSGLERKITAAGKYLYYQGRPGGPLKNPNNLLQQLLMYAVAPMEFKGTVQMVWTYNDERLDTSFAYVPMQRKLRRISPDARADSVRGSDMSMDDAYLWSGKNASFTWSFVGEGEVLVGFATPDLLHIKDRPDGTVTRLFPTIQIGFEVAGWKGAPWAPVNIIWSPRPVWIVQAIPKDPNYNYGRQLFYVDKDTFIIWFKEVYDKSGQYWKGMFIIQSFQIAPSGRTSLFLYDAYVIVDDKTHHATFNKYVEHPDFINALYLPPSILGPNDFTIAAAQQLSK